MTTAAKLRDTILRCAREATEAEPNSVEYRLHSFIAKMSGSMDVMGERDLDEALWGLLQASGSNVTPNFAELSLAEKRAKADVLQAQANAFGALAGSCSIEARLFEAEHVPAPILQGHSELGRLDKYQQVAWRCTTPVDDNSLQIGVAFNSKDGEVLRLRLPVTEVRALCESASEYLVAHRIRVHSRQSPGMPSAEVSTPEDGVKVYPPLMSSTACSGDM